MSEIEKITGNNPEAKSLDITQQNIEQLKQLFPDVFSEGKIDFEALKAVLGEEIDNSEERYNFTWNGKTKARQIAQTPSTGTLRPCQEESVNWDATENLFIEGDNLEVLKLLQKSYHKKVKMIYIDPPYNTGKDFVYKDDFHDNIQNYLEQTGQVDNEGNKLSTNSDTSGRYHSAWLNMIYPRLRLAKNLLKDDGVIFISIDENEVKNLKQVCDEIYGEDNFIGEIIWRKRKGGGNDSQFLAIDHEYILIYAKNKDAQHSKWRVPYEGEYLTRYKNSDKNGSFYWDTLHRGGLQSPIIYDVECPDGTIIKNGTWQISQTSFNIKKEQGLVRIIKNKNEEWSVQHKVYQPAGKVQRSIYEAFTNTDSSNELKDIFSKDKYFDTPKPTGLLKMLLNLSNVNGDDIVLDFFAGSSSFADAVLQRNLSDNINTKFIMVQIPEKIDHKHRAFTDGLKTVSEISLARIKKAIKNINESYGVKFFKLDKTNIRPWDADFDNLELVLQQATESIKPDRSSEDVLYEIFLKYGYDLTTPVETKSVNGKQVFVVGAGALIVCLDDEITGETVEGIAKLKEELDPETTQVVFKDAGFADSNVKTNAIQILKQAGIDDVKSI
ncbi:DNA methylase N-4 [Shewanella algicola]|uniref:site-specific DNA-methyltransferase n=1 Tax=Shewanella algicola TaxID=640633 RepID=UPI00166F298C|nr:site-specific DNA-methyltransferase [Shewanella algicola]GGP67908.1 DNA methylase N-4 [Shewanella algicola]